MNNNYLFNEINKTNKIQIKKNERNILFYEYNEYEFRMKYLKK